MHLKGYFTFCV